MQSMLRYALPMALTVASLHGAAAQDFPTRPVRFIVPYAAGGTSDIVVRTFGQKLSELWGQQLVVDNRAGAGGLIGTEAAARAEPDGYTLYLATDGPLTVAATLHKRLPYDWKRDFAPISMMAVSYQVMLVSKKVPAESLQEFIALAKAKPGALNYASIGIGTSPHIAAERFKMAAKVDITHVPYRGSSSQAIVGLIAGDVSMFMNGTATSVPHIRNGTLRGLAVTSPTRLENAPEIPTFIELGLPSLDQTIWSAVLAPAGTPPAIVKKLNADVAKVASDPQLKKDLRDRGLEVQTMSPDELSAFMEKDYIKVRDVVQALGIAPE